MDNFKIELENLLKRLQDRASMSKKNAEMHDDIIIKRVATSRAAAYELAARDLSEVIQKLK